MCTTFWVWLLHAWFNLYSWWGLQWVTPCAVNCPLCLLVESRTVRFISKTCVVASWYIRSEPLIVLFAGKSLRLKAARFVNALYLGNVYRLHWLNLPSPCMPTNQSKLTAHARSSCCMSEVMVLSCWPKPNGFNLACGCCIFRDVKLLGAVYSE